MVEDVEKNELVAALQSARIASWGRLNEYRLRVVRQFAGTTVLDVGCSTGSYVTYLQNRGHHAIGIDLLADTAWQQAPFAVASSTHLPFPDTSFETLLSFEVVEHIPHPQKAINEMYRVCQKNLILTVPDCQLDEDMLRAGMIFAHWRDRTHCNFFTPQSLQQTLEQAGFWVSQLTHINPIRPDYLVWRSLHLPASLAGLLSRVTRHIPFRKQYPMTLLAVAEKRAKL